MPLFRRLVTLFVLAAIIATAPGCTNKTDRFAKVMGRHDEEVAKLKGQWNRMEEQRELALNRIGAGGNEWLLQEMQKTLKDNEETYAALIKVLRGEFREEELSITDINILWRAFFAEQKASRDIEWKD